MIRKIFFCVTALLVFYCFTFSGCASKPSFEGKADLCGLIVDENNQPVKDFVVHCSPAGGKNAIQPSVITNESGLFVFYGVPSGNYVLSGEKNNYLRINQVPYVFNDRTKIICLQTKTFREAILCAEQFLRLGQKAEAGKVLGNICCEEKSKEQLYVKTFQFYTADNQEKKRALLSDLKKTNNNETNFFKNYSAKLEEIIK